MSQEALDRFLAQAAADQGLAAALRTAVGSATGEAAARAVADFAARRGFAVVPEDVRRFEEQADRAGEAASGDLSDAELERVAGGDVPDTMLSLLTALKAGSGRPVR